MLLAVDIGNSLVKLAIFDGPRIVARWRADARPVPMPGARVIAGAVSEGYDGVVLDVAGPASYAIDDADFEAMARAAAALIADPHVRIAPVSDPSAD